ncbi:MAG: uracil-DNA glycosylase [Actinomycetia bacterium]|nr:uracil-DNA glycosylase [Actinomycetes bacterium]
MPDPRDGSVDGSAPDASPAPSVDAAGRLDPHPVTGDLFTSPVPPGGGWPGDPATTTTPVARTAARVRALARSAESLSELNARLSVCRACPRLVRWREKVATVDRRASFANEPYWGRPGPWFGDPEAGILIVGLAPAANGANRTGRMFTGDASGDFLFAALHRTGYANQPESIGAGDGLSLTGIRIVASVRCAPPENKPTGEEKSTCLPWLGRDLELTPGLHTIMTLGGIGWDATVAAARSLGWQVPAPRPKFGHGAQAELTRPDGAVVRLVGCYHVSPHNTFTGRLTPAMLDEVLRGLRH